MYLKELDVFGFKSFAERVRLTFEPGLTAIVGPNGSGKSNLVEAIRWVLGEHNPRELRSPRMEDVIFAGSPRRRPLGLAEVSLTLDNSDGFFPLDFVEITISRSVDRSGVSEYRLNRAAVRQRDVAALLAGTGVGRQAYAYIGQGRVEDVLNARPEERRLVLEEAAGVLWHKQRREESLRLLRHADLHLTRLRDILHELERHLVPLREEAERAERHRALVGELRETELRLLAGRARAVRERLEGLRREVSRLEEERERDAAELAGLRARCDGHRRLARELEARLDEIAREALAAARREEEARGRHLRAAELLAVAEREAARLRAELAELRGRRERSERGERDEAAELARLEAEVRAARERLAAAEAEAQELEARRAALADRVRRLRDELFEAASAAARARNEAAARARERDLLSRECERLAREERALAAQAARLEERLASLQEEVAGAEAGVAEARRSWQEAGRARAALEGEAAELAAGLHRLREEVRARDARLELLRQLEASHEGYGRGPRAVLEGRARGVAAYRGVLGSVASLLRPRPGLATAVEAALGPAAQYLVVEREEDARLAIEQLKADRAGRATFLPLETLRPLPVPPGDAGLDRREGAVGWAAGVVDCPGGLEVVAAYLLGRVLVARDLPAALALARAARYRYRVVTLEGEVIHPGGAVTGGSRPGAGSGERGVFLLGRAEEVGRLAAEVEVARRELAALERREAEARERLRRAGEAEEEAARHLRLREEALAAARRDLAAAQAEVRQVRERLAALALELRGRERELQEAAAAGEGAGGAAGHEEREAVLRARLQEQESALAAVTAAREEAVARLTQEKVALAALEQELLGRRRWEEGMRARRREQEEEIVRREQALAAAEADGERLKGEASEAAREAAARAEEKAAWEARLAEARREREALLQTLGREEEALRRREEEFRRREERLHAAEVELARLGAEEGALREALYERYGWSGEELPASGAGEDGPALERRARALRAELEELGPVDPRAPQAYRAQQERADALRAALSDLEAARARLADLAERVARRAEEVFRGTWAEARRQFQDTFARLFGGGTADLALDERGGVEIVVQPPGKKTQHLSLLSGGERALAAIALLFALLRVRPAPFCILDEIDSSLDEANLQRFARFLREAAGDGGARTQFIIVTHQKVTMEAADRLFGVTMDETGCSRLVSLRLAQLPA